MASGRPRDAQGRVLLSYQSVRDLVKGQTQTPEELTGRPIVVYRQVSTCVHTVLEHPSVYDKDRIG